MLQASKTKRTQLQHDCMQCYAAARCALCAVLDLEWTSSACNMLHCQHEGTWAPSPHQGSAKTWECDRRKARSAAKRLRHMSRQQADTSIPAVTSTSPELPLLGPARQVRACPLGHTQKLIHRAWQPATYPHPPASSLKGSGLDVAPSDSSLRMQASDVALDVPAEDSDEESPSRAPSPRRWLHTKHAAPRHQRSAAKDPSLQLPGRTTSCTQVTDATVEQRLLRVTLLTRVTIASSYIVIAFPKGLGSLRFVQTAA